MNPNDRLGAFVGLLKVADTRVTVFLGGAVVVGRTIPDGAFLFESCCRRPLKRLWLIVPVKPLSANGLTGPGLK